MRIVSKTPQARSCWTIRLESNLEAILQWVQALQPATEHPRTCVAGRLGLLDPGQQGPAQLPLHPQLTHRVPGTLQIYRNIYRMF